MYEMSGYIKLHRSFVNWEWYKNHVVTSVYLHLLLTANFREDVWHGQPYTRGQVITSYQSLAGALGYSIQQVRTAVNNLKKTGYITVEVTNKFSVITIANWDIYQGGAVASTYRPASNQTDNPQPNQQQIKNIKNINNKEFKKSEYAPTQAKPNAAQSINNSGKYDYEQMRIEARERIRQIIKKQNVAV